MQAPEDLESQPGDSLAEHLVILCTGGAGRTSIEALQPEDGLNRWWFELGSHLRRNRCCRWDYFRRDTSAFSEK